MKLFAAKPETRYQNPLKPQRPPRIRKVQCMCKGLIQYKHTLIVGRPWKVAVVEGVGDVGCGEHTAIEVASIEAAYSVLATFLVGKFDEDLAIIAVEGEADVVDFTVFLLALFAHVVTYLRFPIWLGRPMTWSALRSTNVRGATYMA